MGLGLGLEVPVELGLELLGEGRGDLDVGVAVPAARLEQQHPHAGSSLRRCGEGAAGRAGAHDHVVGGGHGRILAHRGILRPRMARIVVKLGSGVVARDDGALRPDVLAGVCDVVAERHAAGDEIVVVTSGAIARGLQVMGLRRPPDRDRGPAGRQRGRAGQALPGLRRAAARARRDAAPRCC